MKFKDLSERIKLKDESTWRNEMDPLFSTSKYRNIWKKEKE